MKRNFLTLAKFAAKIADDKKAEEVVALNIQKLTSEANYVVIASAGSSTQVNAIRQTIMQEFKDTEGLLPLYCDGRDSVSWSVLDYGGVVIHIMSPQSRGFYNLDKIYSEGTKLKI